MKKQVKKPSQIKYRQLFLISISIIIALFMINLVNAYEQMMEWQDTNSDTAQFYYPYIYSQQFKVGTIGNNITFNLSMIGLNLARTGYPNLIYVYLSNTNVSTGYPELNVTYTGNISEIKEINASQLSLNFAWYNYSFTNGVTLLAGKNYSLILRLLNSSFTNSSLNATIKWGFNNSNRYLGGQNIVGNSNGSTWNSIGYENADMGFIIYKTSDYEWEENNQTYNNATTEGNLETFNITITYNSTYYSNVLASLVYNNTFYSASKYGTGGLITFSKTITIPSVSTNSNLTFYWDISLINATTNHFNSTSYNQSVSNINIGNCSMYSNLLLNLTLKDERTQVNLNRSQFNSTIGVDLELYGLDSNTLFLNYSFIANSSQNASICTNNTFTNSSYRMFSTIQYLSDSYVNEFYYFQNFTLTNTSIPQKIDLYDLLSTESTRFKITYFDNFFVPVENAIINIDRQYIGEGVYKTVEMAKTDILGQAIGHFDTNYKYRTVVTKNGVTLSTFDNVAVFCEDVVTGNCNLNLYASTSGAEPVNFFTYKNFAYTINFSESIRTVTVDFQTLDGSSATISLNASKISGFNNVSLCSNYISTSSGSLDCVIPNTYGNLTFYVYLYKDNQLVTSQIYSIQPKTKEIFGDYTVIIILGYLLTLIFMFIPSVIGVIIGLMLGVILTVILLYTSRNLVGMAGFLSWLILALVIIIWKINRERAD